MIRMDKLEAREHGKRYRRKQLGIVCKIKSNKIANKIINSEDFKNALHVGIYYPIKGEVDLKNVIRKGFSSEKRICLPKSIGNNEMEFIAFNNWKKLSKNKQVMEPTGFNVIPKELLDVIYVPMVAFDKANNRVGFGKGYYDRYLKGFEGQIIGVAFDGQGVDLVKIEKHDIAMDFIITEKK